MRHGPQNENRYHVGLDLGKTNDFSALVVLREQITFSAERDPETLEHKSVRMLSVPFILRLALGTPYTAVVGRVRAVCLTLAGGEPAKRIAPGPVRLIPDATGVGAGVVELLTPIAGKVSRCDGLGQAAIEVVPLVITSGQDERVLPHLVRVPKRDLIQGLALELDQGSIAIAAGLMLADALVEELGSMQAVITPAGRDRYGAAPGKHDDLVLALALAVWSARYKPKTAGFGSQRLL